MMRKLNSLRTIGLTVLAAGVVSTALADSQSQVKLQASLSELHPVSQAQAVEAEQAVEQQGRNDERISAIVNQGKMAMPQILGYAPKAPGFNPGGSFGLRPAQLSVGAKKAPAAISATNPMYVAQVYNTNWTEGDETGLYSWDGSDFTPMGYSNYLAVNGGGVMFEGKYYYNYNFSFMGTMYENYYFIFDPQAMELDFVELDLNDFSSIATQVAYDATSDKVYGQFFEHNRKGYIWGTRDMEYGTTEEIAPMDCPALLSLGFDKQGRAFGVTSDGNFVSIDKISGHYSIVGRTGLNLLNVSTSGAVDPTDDTYYFWGILEDNSSHLYRINLATGRATVVKDFEGIVQLVGASFEPLTYAADVPAQPELSLAFQGADLTGSVTVVAPSVTEGEEVLVEGATIQLLVDGEVVETQASTPGQTLTFNVSVAAPGTHVFQVVAQTAAGESRAATQHQWIGLDVPAAVTDLAIENVDYNHALITWTAPEVGIHNGYIDPARIDYNVVCSDGKVVATGIKDCQFTASLEGDKLTTRSYTVVSCSEGAEGLSAQTSRVYFGQPHQVPYVENFDTQEAFDLWTAEDYNGDGNTWYYNPFDLYAFYGYSYTSGADDWFFSAPVHLTTGHYYELTSHIAQGMSYYEERFDIYIATKPNVESVLPDAIREETILEADGVQSRKMHKFCDPFKVEEEGEYYIAYHCCSGISKLRLELYCMEIALGAVDEAPAAATALKAVCAEKGQLGATVSFKTPTTNTLGQAISTLAKAELWLGDNLCDSIVGIEPGQTYELTDTQFAQQGVNTYRVLAYNEFGKGLPADVDVYVGVDVPDRPQNAQVGMKNGKVTITWEAPSTQGVTGGYVIPEALTYVVYRYLSSGGGYYDGFVYEGTDLECIDENFPSEGAQEQVYYGIFATSAAGMGNGIGTYYIMGGETYLMPFEETLGSNDFHSVWYLANEPNATASLAIGSEPSYDKWGSNFTWSCADTNGGYRTVTSGKIHINEAPNPALSFQFMAANADDYVELLISADSIVQNCLKTTVATFHATDFEGWNRAHLDLSQYAGRDIILGFRGNLTGIGEIILDDIIVRNELEYNIAVRNISGPTVATVGEASEITVEVANEGLQPAEGVSIELLSSCGTEGVVNLSTIEPGQNATAFFEYIPTVNSPLAEKLSAKVVFAKDGFAEDDVPEQPLAVSINKPAMPAAIELAADQIADGVVLNWKAPAQGDAYEVVFEDFESGTPFAAEFGDWTMHDVDGATNYYMSGSDTTLWNGTCASPKAFFVWNPVYANYNYHRPHSGNQCLFAMEAMFTANDDWAITPELSGAAQTLSIWIGSPWYTEPFEFYYSTTGTEVSDMILYGSYTLSGPGNWSGTVWQQYDVELPEGAKYFGVRYIGNTLFAIEIDDVTYQDHHIVSGDELQILGYNIYRNGQKLNAEPVTDLTFVDEDPANENTYVVRAVYAQGESLDSNEAIVNGITGITTVNAQAAAQRRYDLMGRRSEAKSGILVGDQGVQFVK